MVWGSLFLHRAGTVFTEPNKLITSILTHLRRLQAAPPPSSSPRRGSKPKIPPPSLTFGLRLLRGAAPQGTNGRTDNAAAAAAAAGGEEESEQEHEASEEERDKIRLEVTLEVRKEGRKEGRSRPRVDRLILLVGREGERETKEKAHTKAPILIWLGVRHLRG